MPVSYRKSNSKIPYKRKSPLFRQGRFFVANRMFNTKRQSFRKKNRSGGFRKSVFLARKKAWDIGKNSLHGFAICSKIVKYVALGFVCPFCGRVENYETGCCPSFGETPAEQFVP